MLIIILEQESQASSKYLWAPLFFFPFRYSTLGLGYLISIYITLFGNKILSKGKYEKSSEKCLISLFS